MAGKISIAFKLKIKKDVLCSEIYRKYLQGITKVNRMSLKQILKDVEAWTGGTHFSLRSLTL